jgi:hypothetical protein
VRCEWKEKKGGALRWCASLKAARGGGRGRRGGGNGGRERWAAKPWVRAMRWSPLTKSARHSLGTSVRTVRLTGGPQAVLIFFQFIQNWLNFKNSKWVPYYEQFFHAACLGYYELFSQLCRHPIPNTNRAKNPGLDLTFESLMNFKIDLNLPEKSGKFSKILS